MATMVVSFERINRTDYGNTGKLTTEDVRLHLQAMHQTKGIVWQKRNFDSLADKCKIGGNIIFKRKSSHSVGSKLTVDLPTVGVSPAVFSILVQAKEQGGYDLFLPVLKLFIQDVYLLFVLFGKIVFFCNIKV